MHSKTLGTVAIWLVGGAALAGAPPAVFPPPTLPPLTENVPPPLQGRRAVTTQALTPFSQASPYFAVGKLTPLDGRPVTPITPLTDSPYFATSKLTALAG